MRQELIAGTREVWEVMWEGILVSGDMWPRFGLRIGFSHSQVLLV
jgi:hypothetical protein